MTEHGSDLGARTGLEVAIVGLAGRFPGADDVDAFWRNLRGGVESISFFSREELLAAGADAALVDRPDFVPAGGVLRGADEFDATLFHLTPRDAEVLNPQHRLLLECAWEALEQAGYDPDRVGRPVAVFAGASSNDYAANLLSTPELVSAVGEMRITLGNGNDHLAAGISYRLNLRGPSIVVQTACSTSLVAVHLACQSLLGSECDMALAGGVSVPLPFFPGHVYAPDGIVSPDGHCRAFDADARGTVGGSGAGMVLLKRLDDALADGDTIHAVIRGSAINNDGAEKVGYTAPSVTGQARVLSDALSMAGVDAASVQYVETHGSGTPLGDAIELKAMSQVLSRGGAGRRCAIGSVKTNIGHLDAAAGVAGLIKTVLALEHGELPPSLHCAVPHPEIEASGGRVFVNTSLTPWARNGAPRRAGVSSFGIGGTNAHVVLEEAPAAGPSGPSRALQLLVVSARTPSALATAAENLARHLEREAPSLADAAFTLQLGRREMEHRMAVVCGEAADGAARLRAMAAHGTSAVPRTDRPVAFMFPGVGTHHVDMGRGLYGAEPVFRDAVDECCELLRPVLESDLREVLFPAASPDLSANTGPGGSETSSAAGGWDLRRLLGRDGDNGVPGESPLHETRFAQPAVFVVEYALARLWTSWGVRPRALIGHSLGEYVAACVAGVLRLEDALRLVALRARLIDALPAGAMLAVPLGEAAVRELLPSTLDVAAVNTPESCVVAGPVSEVEAFEAALAERGTVSRRLPARHAFHSRDMAAVSADLERLVSTFELRAPEIPLVSSVTGTWISDEEARSPAYWARHLCRTIRFADGVATLRAEPGWVFLEVGPGQALGAWARHHPAGDVPGAVFSSLPHQHNHVGDLRFVLETLGGVWTAGVEVDWTAFSGGERRRRIPLPGYPFERKRYWVAAPRRNGAGEGAKRGGAAAGEAGVEPLHEKGPGVVENRVAPWDREAAAPAREEAVLKLLTRIVADLTGIGEEDVETDADFFQAGLDSLLLLQAIQRIETTMGVRVSLVELLEEITTLRALAAHLDRVVPPGALPIDHRHAAAPPPVAAEPPRVMVAPPALYPVPAALRTLPEGGEGGALERVIARQLQVMSEQIAALRGEAAPVRSAAAAIVETAPVPVAAAPRATSIDALAAAAAAAPALRAVPQTARAKIQPATFVPYHPVSNEGRNGFTPEQSAYLDAFIARYVERTRASKAHQARYHLPLADSRVTARFRRAWKEILYPIVGDRALGSRVWDVDGNEYVDTGMAFGCTLFGHAPDFVSRAIQAQVERGYGVGPQSPHAGRAAELVCDLGGNARAVFCNSGTEAVMGAIRAARALTGRSKVAIFAGSYHGWSDVVLGRSTGVGDRREVRPVAPGVAALPLGDVVMLDYDEPASLGLLSHHLHELALVMVEPVQSRRPDLQPFAFLRELRRMTREAGVPLLFDELITGFRMGPGGAQAFFGIQADLVTYGKIVAGGLPMGVVAGTREAMSVFDGGLWSYGDDSYPTAQRTLFAGAYFKHPLSMAVACAILEEIERQGAPMYEALNARTTGLVERMNAFFEAGRYPVTAVHFSSCFRFFFGPEVPFPDLFNHHLIAEGIHVIPETGTHFLSAAHTADDLERIFDAVRASAEAMRRGGFIPPSPGSAAEPGPRDETAPVVSVHAAGPGPAAEWREGVRTLPLTEGQRQLWLESQMGDDAALAYHESTSVRLSGALDVSALRRAVEGVVARHETLRMTFAPDGESQRIHPPSVVDVPLADFRGAAPGEREAALEEWVRGCARRPFDLVAGPLVRFALAALEVDEHLLVITTHHAVLDGWSFGVIWNDLSALYTAAREGRAPALAPPPDHAAAVRAQAAATCENAFAEAYWLAQFADGVPVLDLPTDRPRPPVRGYGGERVERVIGGGLTRRLADGGRPHGLTLFGTVLSAYFVWLSRLSGRNDVVVGTPAAGQAARVGANRLVGYGINVLPIRARLSGRDTFLEHARAVRRTLLGGLENQGFSFPRLVEKLLKTRDPSRPPVFAAMLNLDRDAGGSVLGRVKADFSPNFTGGAKVDLSFRLTETADALRLCCDFSAELFDPETIAGWLAGFERLLEEVARDPGTRLGDLELLGAAERRRVMEEWNGTDRPRVETCLHRLFEAQAAATPDAVAVDFAGRAVTYAALDRAANQVAHALQRRGVKPETCVALFMENGPELVGAILGVLKAGGAYVPLDTASPPDRVSYVLADSGAALVLADPAAVLPAGTPPVIHVTTDAFAGEAPDAPRTAVQPRNLVYVIYTSGSTGRPKGVLVEHRGVCNTIANYVEAYGVHAGARVLCFAPVHFDASVTDLFTPLCSGATLVMAPRDSLIPGAELVEMLRERRVTHAKFTPSALTALPFAELPELEAVMTGGEACTAELVARWGPGRRFINGYGPTEGSVRVTAVECADGTRTPGLGRPQANTRVYVVDADLRPVPVGVPGELCIGGIQVARGYLGRGALTAAVFVPDPFGATPGGRLYRSGDRVRHRHDGTLEFLGRTDFQVKVRGYRIETGEVEAVLRDHPGVRDALVVAREDEPGDRRLVAYVAPESGAAPTPQSLRDALRERLPEYMVPSAYVLLERFPVTSSGKVDRAALPAPGRPAAGPGHAAPRTPVEEALAGIWAEVLRLRSVSRHDDFFELGGHSLLATRVVSRVRELFGVELKLRALFEAPTVAGLAARIEALRRAGEPGSPPLVPLVPMARGGRLPLSLMQERFWFMDRMPGGASYVIPVQMRLEGDLDVPALERAVGEIVRRHEALRTTFLEDDDGPVQVVTPFAGFTLTVEDLSAVDADEREALAVRRATEKIVRPFDLSAGPLIRVSLLRLAPREHVFLLNLHHAISDGWSLDVFFAELTALYGAFREGGESPLAELPVQYPDYAVWQRRHLEGERLARELEWWRERLAGAPVLLELPADHPRPAVMAFRGGWEPVHVPAELIERLQALARREGATLYMVLLGAFQALLARYAGVDDVVVGTTVAGRTRREVEGLIGLFMNTLALRFDLSGDPPFRELLRRVREVTLGAYEHQEVPFDRLVAELRPERTLSHTPVYQVLFDLLNTADSGTGPPGLPGLAVRDQRSEGVALKCDLSVSLTATPRGVEGALLYSTELFEPRTARRMVEHLERVLEQVAGDPDRRLSRIELAGPDDRAQVAEWNRTPADRPADRCIHHLFEARARETPDAVAVVFQHESLSYRALNERANRLAHHLRERGVGPDVRVGLCVERGLEMMVGLLGVLKAGGAYVPLDPSYPVERLAYMLGDSAPAVVLAQQGLRDRLGNTGVPVLELDASPPAWADRPATDPVHGDLTPAHLAYVIYTSGSTGRPKGVMNPHRNVTRLFAATEHWFDFGAADVWTLFHSIAFDFSVWEMWGALLHGGRLVIVSNEITRSPEALYGLVCDEGVTVLNQTPGAFYPFMHAQASIGREHRLRHVIFGGEALDVSMLRPWFEENGDTCPRLVNMYGITETTVHVTYRPLAWPDVDRAGASPIGERIPDLRAYLLDRVGEPVPVGMAGELYIGGAGVARGYLGRPGLTAERFVSDPFSGDPGARLYRTGDLARWLPGGSLEYLGRTDHQVKVRGFRIELGEIEARITQHPGVREAVVIAREDTPGEKRLVAYLVGDDTAGADVLRAHVGEILPAYMVPAAYVRLERWPLTPNGKLDRKALPAPDGDAYASREYEAPVGETEQALAEIWSELLGIERVGRRDDFFELGGHSLLALRLFTRVNRRLGCDLPVSTLFAGATVRQMADALMEQRRTTPTLPPSVVVLQPRGTLPPVFFIHSADRDVMGYVGLVRHLGTAQPAFGVRDLGDLARPVEQIASEHVDAIRAAQPHGPYALVSWSFGGVVAFEVALQLQRLGETVAFVGLMDTLSPALMREWSWARDCEVVAGMAYEAAELNGRPLALTVGELEGLDGRAAQVAYAAAALRAQGAVAPEYPDTALDEAVRGVHARVASGSAYVPGHFCGTLTLFSAADTGERHERFFANRPADERRTLGWSSLASEPVEVHDVPGTHATLASEPHVRVLARHLRESLAAARERAAGSPNLALVP